MYGGEPQLFELPAIVAGGTGSTVPEKVPIYHGGVDSIDEFCDFERIDGVVYSDVDLMPRGNRGDQLTISYCGQVYVFDNVSTDKMQKVFLHLGGCDLSTGQQCAESYQNLKDFNYSGRCSDPRRAASLNRFRQKRKERCFEKKIKHNDHQKAAFRMNHKKGRFVISPNPNDSALSAVVGHYDALPDDPNEPSVNMSTLNQHFEI